ncbi:D-malate degradation protein R [Serratia entomophila]|uniref:LysR family transcriptional regulator n=1 Tax=Serratia entomophila TaxID=42906 RepID=UPI00217BD16B|nr:LysR family transcriptional regulator [Serratia entomophila]CAI0737831.1 D-malate degradation protein R [Serratia entomophila]CAI1655967.1 D-malate degradation protein R [Serratia entomophila]CAI1657909.1 D-malate degradation protein R [Serratia entomophila]CAI1672360.1 D-malate degradation protein R [Serratia entomophila]CAI1774181.1 D-malate degradation protein R [Serratia entomophila]
MDKLNAMNTFLRVAESGSLSAAARELGLTQPAVSQQIAGLEQRLGAQLLYRSTRAVTLTEAGGRYYRQVKPILAAVAEAEETLNGLNQRLQGSLRIHAPTGFGQRHLTPLAIAFQQRHPELNIELLLDDRRADVVGEGVDVAIRFGELNGPGTVARRLGDMQRVLVASPAYLARHGAPQTLAELAAHGCVRYSGLNDGDALTLLGPQGNETVDLRPVFRANNTFSLLAAIEAGLGIGGAQRPLIGPQLAAGTLVQVLANYRYPPMTLHAVYPAARFIPGKVRAWVDYLRKALESIEGITVRNAPDPLSGAQTLLE